MNDASSFLLALIPGTLPSLVWLWFWLREDNLQPEPRKLLVATFFSGVVAVIGAVVAEKYVQDLVSDPTTRYAIWAAVEEVLKFVAVAVIALPAASNDEPIDAMVYMVVAALGFAALENTLFLLQPLSGGEYAQSIVTGNMRFIGATLVHVVSSATIGFALGYVFYKGVFAKILAIVVGLSAAITLHAAFNLSIINAGSADTLKAFAWVWAAVIILIVLFEEVKAVEPPRQI